MKEKFWKILPYSGYVLFFSLGLLVFFVSAFLVVLVRTKEEQKILMPNVVGKNYIEVHNELQRLQLKVRLEKERIPEKTDGIILTQSIDAGKEVEAGSKLYLTVNVGFDRVVIPDVKGQDLKRAKAILERVLAGEVYVPLEIGGITYVPAKGEEPSGMVIDQIPQAGKDTHAGEKIYLLVTEPNVTNDKQSKLEDLNPFLATPTPFFIDLLQRKKIPYELESPAKPEFRTLRGLVSKLSWENGIIKIQPYWSQASHPLQYDYELLEYEVDDDDTYSASIVAATQDGEKTREIFTSIPKKEDSLVRLFVYRSNPIQVRLEGKKTGLAKEWNLGGTY